MAGYTIEVSHNSELVNCGARHRDIFERMANELTLADLEDIEKILDLRGSWGYVSLRI